MSVISLVTRDPAIREQDGLIYIALGLATLGVVTLYHGARDLAGQLIVDDEGVRVWPPCFGPRLSWESIARWRVETSPNEAQGTDEEREPCLVISLRGRWLSRRLPASVADSPGFDQLVKEFRRQAGSREELDLA
jgi:hypothetical protein